MNQPTPTAAPAQRRQRADGRRSRDAILDNAARLATVEGLEGLSIARLAERTGMSKSGLYAHFTSKEELQLATIERAQEIFETEVLRPARMKPDGLRRLWALSDEFLSHLERNVFPGGCFFAAVGAEFDTHPGRVKERIGVFIEEWVGELVAAAAAAQRAGELPADPDPEQLTYEVDALLLMAHAAYTMYGDPALLERARVGLARLLGPRPE
ncbi:MAG TPA: TetR/AcrR family transcriptional regulator [Gaiellales bacterium]|nr:TetR/AcrR family transcriptional regulator [Gaiellales bacterium]